MATPRPAGPNKTQGKATQPPFGKGKSNVPKQAKQPPIPASKPASSKRFANKGKPGMSGFGGDKSRGY